MTTEITWHEFPKEHPPEEDGKYTTDLVDYDEAKDYLCTIMPCNIPRVVCLRYLKSHTWVDGDEAIKIDGEFCDEDYSSYHVIAWADLPKPYKR